jgi:hypothetical protein
MVVMTQTAPAARARTVTGVRAKACHNTRGRDTRVVEIRVVGMWGRVCGWVGDSARAVARMRHRPTADTDPDTDTLS